MIFILIFLLIKLRFMVMKKSKVSSNKSGIPICLPSKPKLDPTRAERAAFTGESVCPTSNSRD